MTEFLLLSIVVLAAGLLLAWMVSPWRSLIGWVCMLSVQLNYRLLFADFRPALSDLFLPSMVVGLVFGSSKLARGPDKRSALSTLVLAFAAVFFLVGNTVSYLQLATVPQWTWLNKDTGLVDLMLCYFAFLRLVDSRERLHAIARVFVLSGSAINLVALMGGIARYIFGIPNMMMRDDNTLRLTGFMVNPNSYGGFLLCVLLLQFALLLGNSGLLRFSRRAQYLNLALLGMACVMTQSRSVLLGMVAGMIALLGFYRAKASARLVGVTVVIVLGTVAVVHWYTSSPTTSAEFWDVELSGRTIAERVNTNTAAWHMYLESPQSAILGIGVGTFYSRGQQVLRIPLVIHSGLLWLLVEVGPLGLFICIAIFLASLRNCLAVVRARVVESPIAIGVGCGIIGTVGWTVGTEGLWHRHVWFLFALSEACYRICVRERAVRPIASSQRMVRVQVPVLANRQVAL